jgi:hypothetical protein
MKTLLIVWVLISAPISLFVIGWGLSLIYEEAGMLALVLSSAALITCLLGVLSLLDRHQPPPSQRQADR